MSSKAPDAAAARSVNSMMASFCWSWTSGSVSIDGWQLEWRNGHHVLTRHLQRLPGGGDHPHVRSSAEDLAHQPSGRLEQVLAVVEEEQQPPLSQVSDQDVHRPRGSLVPEVERAEHGVGHEGRLANLAELDQPGSVREAPCELGSGPKGEPRLAHATRADQAHHARGRELPPDLSELAAAADKCGRLRRQVARRLPRSRHPGFE